MFSVHAVHDSLFLYTCLRLHFIMTDCLSNMIINPRRTCAARVTVVVLYVCLSVCLFVYDYSRTTDYEAAYERYQHLQCYNGTKTKLPILLKQLSSRDVV